MYADDTSLILNGDELSLNNALNVLEWFENISGLKVNFDKTQVIWIGNKKFSNEVLCKRWGLKWGQTKFTLLGLNFDVNLENICTINYNSKIQKIREIIKRWDKRNMSSIGKYVLQ